MTFGIVVFCFFFFKQKTAYEMRISDWSSDVCSSDLIGPRQGLVAQPVAGVGGVGDQLPEEHLLFAVERVGDDVEQPADLGLEPHLQIGRASCRERVCQYV